jgi:hypothetical protein
MLATRQVLHEAHHQAIFVAGIDDNRWYFRLTELLESLEAPLSADQIVSRAILALSDSYGDRPFQPQLGNIINDLPEGFSVPHARIHHGDAVHRN